MSVVAIELISQARVATGGIGDTFMLAFCLCAVSIFRTLHRRRQRSRRRRDGRRSSWRARPAIQDRSVRRSVRSQSGLAPTEPEQSRSYIAESLALNDALGTAVVDENALSMVLMASAVLGDRDDCAHAMRPSPPPRALARRRDVRVSRGDGGHARRWTRPRSLWCCTEPSTHLLPGFVRGELNATLRHRANATIITQLDAASVAELAAARRGHDRGRSDRLRPRRDRACDLIAEWPQLAGASASA